MNEAERYYHNSRDTILKKGVYGGPIKSVVFEYLNKYPSHVDLETQVALGKFFDGRYLNKNDSHKIMVFFQYSGIKSWLIGSRWFIFAKEAFGVSQDKLYEYFLKFIEHEINIRNIELGLKYYRDGLTSVLSYEPIPHLEAINFSIIGLYKDDKTMPLQYVLVDNQNHTIIRDIIGRFDFYAKTFHRLYGKAFLESNNGKRFVLIPSIDTMKLVNVNTGEVAVDNIYHVFGYFNDGIDSYVWLKLKINNEEHAKCLYNLENGFYRITGHIGYKKIVDKINPIIGEFGLNN